MRATSCILGLALSTLSAVSPAQEARAPFDAAAVLFPETTSIMRTGDVDGDQIPDAIGWYYVDNLFNKAKVSLFRGNGDGTFASLATVGNFVLNGTTAPWALEFGRFNGDLRDDYALAFDQTIYVYTSGPGGVPTFLAMWNQPWSVRSMVVADFDQDGLDDIAVAGSGVRLYRNTGTGFQLSSGVGFGTDIRGGNFDASPGKDLFVMSGLSLQVLSCAGGVVTPGPSFTHGFTALQVPHPVAGDIDQDGDDDIVVFSNAGSCVVIRCTAPLTFVKEPTVVGGPATDLVDLDGDGDLDGACCGGGGPSPSPNEMPSTYRVSLNDGDGGFQLAYDMKGLGAWRLAGAVDVDGDGDRDLVAGRCVIFNRGGFPIEPQPVVPSLLDIRIDIGDPDRDGDPDISYFTKWWLTNFVTKTSNGSGGYTAGFLTLPTPPGSVLFGPGYVGDFDQDGDDDLIAYQQTGTVPDGMRMFLNAGGGGYTLGPLATSPGVFFTSSKASLVVAGRSAAADFDADGDLDVLAGYLTTPNQAAIWLNDGAGFFSSAGMLLGMGNPAACGDLDHDGRLDVVGGSNGTAIAVAFGHGDGSFEPVVTLMTAFAADVDRLCVADFDSDGREDIALINRSTGDPAIHVWKQTAPRSFAKTSIPFTGPFASAFPMTEGRRTFALDVDQDGDFDLMAGPQSIVTGTIRIYENDGTGTLTQIGEQVVANPREMADVDGDGDVDLIGDRVVRNARHLVPDTGYRRQFGASKAGLGGMAPTLGAVGPFATNATIELRITGARGGSVALFSVGLQPSNVANWPAYGVTGYVFPSFLAVVLPLDGTPNTPGTGDLFLPVVVPPAASGFAFFHQAFVYDVDAAPGLWSQTNGLELRFP